MSSRSVESYAYRVLAGEFQSLMAVVSATFLPRAGGETYATDAAVLDSGADFTFVPHGVPRSYGWSPAGLQRARVRGLGGGGPTDRYLATIQVGAFRRDLPVWEMLPETELKCVLVGQDVLRHLLVVLNGPRRELRIIQRWS